jgi:hypothetical protein
MTNYRGEWNDFQIGAQMPPEPDLTASGVARSRTDIPIRRPIDMKICNFGALTIGARKSDDYTRTELFFKDKDTLADWKVITEDGGAGGRGGLRSVTIDLNPYVWGSTVKKVRDDQFFRMEMDNNTTGNGIEKPKFDVSDTNVAQASMFVAGKKYPSEGWRSLGGKYDLLALSVDGDGNKLVYDGVLR